MTAISADHRLLLRADTPFIDIALRDSRQGFLDLPALQFAFAIDAYCVDDLQPVSLSVSVADTRRTLRPSDMDFAKAIEVSLDIPANQLAPVAIRDFCLRTDVGDINVGQAEPAGDAQLTLPATLTAQASLRCANDLIEQTVYVAKSLDITLVCQTDSASTSLR
jgi:hypothetical protein